MTSQLRFTALTLFPEMFEIVKSEGVVARAIQNQIIKVDTVPLRLFAQGSRKNVDDSPIGGGDGMVIKPDVAQKAVESCLSSETFVVHLTPFGKVFDHKIAKTLALKKHILLLCGRYAGYDFRFAQRYADLHLSVGDFILSGGELPALCVIDAVSRFVPHVLHNPQSSSQDSFEDSLLESPQYTHPKIFAGEPVPEVLLSGDHKKVSKFKRKEQLKLTAIHRPDLIMLAWETFTEQEKTFIKKIWKST